MADLHVRGVGKSFGGKSILRDNDLGLPDGKILALLGPSGCGKTTLLRLIAGFDRVDLGEIALGGDLISSVAKHVPPERRRVGYVPQEGVLFPHLSVGDNILYGLPRRERRLETIADLLSITGLTDLVRRYPHEISGGQQQRVALARALAPKPDLVVLDEPFNALDLDLRRSVCEDVISVLRASGASALIVTHDPQEAFMSADLMAVMREGRIEQADDPVSIYQTPAKAELAAITGPAIFIDGVSRGGHVETALGALALRRDTPPGPVIVLLRPEQIALAAPGDGPCSSIVSVSYRGDHSLAVARLQSGEALQFRIAAPARLAAGDAVHLRVLAPCVAYSARPR